MKNKGISLGLVLVIIIAVLGISLTKTYNNLNVMDESINAKWGQVENQLKRRADLIPNLLETVKGYAGHEKEVIQSISDARAGYSSAHTPEEYAEAEQKFGEAVKSLNIMVENYPDLKANENFKEFQVELAGTENRIATERMYYNEAIEKFNKKIRRFPTNLIAKMFGFEVKPYFEITDGEREPVKVEF